MSVTIEVVSPGLLSTVQDLGRFGFAHLGISPAGAADALSLRIANRLVGNVENAACIEMTLVGATLRFPDACTIALAGAQIASAAVPMLEPVRVEAGFVLECGPLREGARSYLAIRGGLKVHRILGSASTHLAAGFGGLGGRALRRGDLLEGEHTDRTPPRSFHVDKLRELLQPRHELRVVWGPQQQLFAPGVQDLFCSSQYEVTEQSNRLGLRLSGTPIRARRPVELLTEGVSLGAIQIPPDGQPIILFVDQQTTGGYAKLANVISADIHYLGQLRPRDLVRFRPESIEEAIDLLRRQELVLEEAFRA